ncbi:ketopantoate reductase C-terminal domain-containing protein, partial [Streptococcus pyogenes]
VNLDAQEAIHFIETKAYNRETLGLHYPSMHQDLIQNNRLTEIDSINGAIAKKGRKYGIPTPYSNLVTNLIHAKEELRKAK